MTTIQAIIPDFLAELAHEAADKEQTSLDNIVSIALAAHVGARRVRTDIEARAQRGIWKLSTASSTASPPIRRCRGMNCRE